MKGLIFRFPAVKRKSLSKSDVLYYFRRYGLVGFLVASLLAGLVTGAIIAKNADVNLMKSLDFIFVTDFQAKLNQSIFITFAAAMTSYFIFFITEFLLGLSAWGAVGVPIVIFFKGMGIGLSSGYLYNAKGLQGVGFYLLVMLLGVVASSVALVAQGKGAVSFANSIWYKLYNKKSSAVASEPVITKYLVDSSYVLIGIAIAALVDALLTTFFSGLFNF
ncbi:MAG TPA: hypothetical protein GX401_05550 [Clostridiales bacterium]|nr:hypothetical protein [Clostridiales bacterium]